jgi:hypothetical protein
MGKRFTDSEEPHLEYFPIKEGARHDAFGTSNLDKCTCETPAIAINAQTKGDNIIIFNFGPFRDAGSPTENHAHFHCFHGHPGAQATAEQTPAMRATRQPWAAVSGVARRSPVTVRVVQMQRLPILCAEQRCCERQCDASASIGCDNYHLGGRMQVDRCWRFGCARLSALLLC